MADETPKKTTRRSAPRKKAATAPKKTTMTQPEEEVRDFGAQFVERQQKKGVPQSYIKGVVTIILIAVIAGLLGIGATRLGLVTQNSNDEFKAVFLTNGQVYFGNITKQTSDTVILDNVFYVQLIPTQVQKPDGTTETVNQPQLIRKGTEFYGPESKIEINRDQVTVIEVLREDTQVMQDIRAQLAQ